MLGLGDLGLDRVPNRHGQIGAANLLDRTNSGRRGDIDFRQIAVDDVDADEQKATPPQFRANGRADPPFFLGQLRFPRRSAAPWSRNPATSTPAALGEIATRDRARWADIVAKRGIQSE